jgi:hypothetical protein
VSGGSPFPAETQRSVRRFSATRPGSLGAIVGPPLGRRRRRPSATRNASPCGQPSRSSMAGPAGRLVRQQII